MLRWLKWIALVSATGFVLAYLCDWAVFRLRGAPSSTVTINSYQTVPLKGHKYEYDYLGSNDQPCSVSLFPHGGQDPCWWLRRHRNQVTNL